MAAEGFTVPNLALVLPSVLAFCPDGAALGLEAFDFVFVDAVLGIVLVAIFTSCLLAVSRADPC